jgi:trans-2,3-dihydro-3-hydroxyanthranilate isomerase
MGVRPDAVARAVPSPAVGDLCLYAWDPSARRSHARVFAGGSGVAEDPATGSAALGFGVYLVANGLLPGDGESSYVVHQGAELHRPSTLDCTVTAAGGSAVSATVRGHVVPIARGEIAVPPFVG